MRTLFGIDSRQLGTFVVRAAVAILPAAALGCGAEDPPLGHENEPVVFGSDDRVEYGGITSDRDLRLANATAAQFLAGDVTCTGGNCSLSTAPFTATPTDNGFQPLCSSERFRNQEQGANCTAFLIGPQLFATAGHCVECGSTFGDCSPGCTGTRLVFGFTAAANGGSEVTTVPESDVYSCVSARGVWADSEDFAVFEVDRVVQGRIPMFVRYTGSASVGAGMMALGYPDGLPLKLAPNGLVKEDLGAVNMGTSLDAFAGNSGSPVMDSASGVVEGIHVRRPYYHYLFNAGSSCAQSNVCSATTGCNPNFGTSAWAQATRFPWVASKVIIPLHTALLAAIL